MRTSNAPLKFPYSIGRPLAILAFVDALNGVAA